MMNILKQSKLFIYTYIHGVKSKSLDYSKLFFTFLRKKR